MANAAAHLVDRVLPDVPVRQYVLSLPYELRRLAAFKADVLTALARIFVEAVFASYRARRQARRGRGRPVRRGQFRAALRQPEPQRPLPRARARRRLHARRAGSACVSTRQPAPTVADLDAIVGAYSAPSDRLAAPPRLPRRAPLEDALERAARADGARRVRRHRHGARQRRDAAARRRAGRRARRRRRAPRQARARRRARRLQPARRRAHRSRRRPRARANGALRRAAAALARTAAPAARRARRVPTQVRRAAGGAASIAS